jgi:LuxR family maltose regulon positive regulatory protein
MYLRGNAAGAVEYLDDQLARTSYYTVAHAGLLQALGFMHWLTGDLTNLAVAADHLLTVSEEQVLPDQKALAHWFLGTVSYARNELQAAERHLTEAVSARFNMRLLWWCQAAGILALTHDATARPEQARQTLEDVHAFLLERHAIRLLPNIGAFQAELDRRQGRMAEAVAWAKVVDLVPLIWPLAAVEPHLERVLVLISLDGEAELDEAAGILAELRDLCRRIPNRRLQLQIDAFAALLLEEQGQREAALQALERAVIAAEPEGWTRLFVDLGEPMASLLTELSRRRVAPHAAARILAAFPARHVAAGSPDQSRLIEPLSARELEILALLSQRDSNKEIAARLFIARGTVKRHTVNIYRKLGVNDRREAVLAAHKLGLLPAHTPAEQA